MYAVCKKGKPQGKIEEDARAAVVMAVLCVRAWVAFCKCGQDKTRRWGL